MKPTIFSGVLAVTTATVFFFIPSLIAAPTVVTVKDDVLVEGVSPFGINMGGQNYWQSPKLKIRSKENFEGSIYRQAHTGTLYRDGFVSMLFQWGKVEKWWGKLGLTNEFYKGATATILTGPNQWKKVKLKGIAPRQFQNPWDTEPGDFLCFEFEEEIDIAEPKSESGLLIEIDASREGNIGRQLDGETWMTTNCKVMQGDTAAETYGYSALMLDATEAQKKLVKDKEEGDKWVDGDGSTIASFSCPTSWSLHYDLNGKWHAEFWAKDLGGADFSIVPNAGKAKISPVPVPLTNEWKKYDIVIEVSGVDESKVSRSQQMGIRPTNVAGKMAIDDIVVWKETEDKNPTAFCDEFVESLKYLRVGGLRQLMMGGTMADRLAEPLRGTRSTNNVTKSVGPLNGRSMHDWSMKNSFELCEYLDAEAWFSVPGTVFLEEIDFYMEFLGGPETTPGGKLRTEQGHPKPYTETLKKIHVEFGNEAWNTRFGYLVGGFNGPDYWEALFARLKKSPYYKPNVICHAAGQNYSASMSKRILDYTPSADCYAIAPYQMHGIEQEQVEDFPKLEDFFAYCMAYPCENIKTKLAEQGKVAEEAKRELSIYEVNYHITGGILSTRGNKEADANMLAWVNTFVASPASGTSNMNHLLAMLRNHKIRTQEFFTYEGEYNGIKLWGVTLRTKPGQERYRPTGLALRMANGVIGGNMIATEQDNTPTFAAHGQFPSSPKKGKTKGISDVENSSITSYAFKKDGKYGLVLCNLDTQSAQEVLVQAPSAATNIRIERLAYADVKDNNELDLDQPEAKVTIAEETLPSLDKPLTIAPGGMVTLSW